MSCRPEATAGVGWLPEPVDRGFGFGGGSLDELIRNVPFIPSAWWPGTLQKNR